MLNMISMAGNVLRAGAGKEIVRLGGKTSLQAVRTFGREAGRRSFEQGMRNVLRGGVQSLNIELGGETYRDVLTAGAEKLKEWTKGKINVTEAAACLDELTKNVTIRDTDVLDMIKERRRQKREQQWEEYEDAYEETYEEEASGREGLSREEMEMLIQMYLLMREMKQQEEKQEK